MIHTNRWGKASMGLSFWLCAALLTCAVHGQARQVQVECWGIFELSLTGPSTDRSFLDTPLSARFSHGHRHMTVPGFYDGNGRYLVRFSPPATGRWTYVTTSKIAKLNNQTGAFTATTPSKENHGPIEIFKTWYLRYTDGTPYHQFGTTCYAWIHQTDALQKQTLKTLASSPFNKIRFCVFPKDYSYNKNEPDLFAFRKGRDGKFDYSLPDPAFWHHLEQRILDLQKLGVEADIILWHPYDRWGFKKMSDEQDDQYLRYCIARLSAYRNVWWSLANEYDFMSDLDGRHRGIKTMDDWDRFFSILQKEDPFQRMRGIHNGSIWYDHSKDWVIHTSIQTSDMNGGVRFRNQHEKPVIYDECKYEGNIPQGWGNIDARTMTQRFWLGTLGGCYVGHGETYKHPKDILWWSKGGVLHGQSPQRIQWLKDFMKTAPAFDELVPMGDDKGLFMLGKKNEYYLVYCQAGQTQAIELAGSHAFKVDAIDPWKMTEWPVGSMLSGTFTATAQAHDRVYRFTRYAPGEAMRPEARPTASVTEGIAPLTVTFKSNTRHSVVWDFSDGTQSKQRTPEHTFSKSGIYTVAMTVTDGQGATARGHVAILVDRDSTDPIVHAGINSQETPALTLKGTAKRGTDGRLAFPTGQPWGRAETQEDVSDALGALRSFTITGWLKPDDLTIGSGGNRILFCLQRSSAGIDLVHLADGRMRLAVNQWPDRVSNDSAPGRLVRGKWTFFKVTYSAPSSRDNVAWSFSRPLDQPDNNAPIHLDRRNTYNVGAVANQIGPLAIGNFNRTMKSYGYDRQFRGQIRDVKVFGSRISSRGALDAQVRSTHPPKQRVFVLTDISNEPDDEESMVRFLVYANEYDIEGLVATTSTHLRNRTREDLIRRQLDAYGQVRGNLLKHAKGYPTQAQLLAVTATGQPAYGMNAVGKDKSSAGSRLLLAAADKVDQRPLWISVWGGANTLAQALRDAREERSPEDLARLVAKLRVYTISDQDDAGRWLRLEFPGLFYIVSPSSTGWEEYYEATWTGISGDRHYSNAPFVDFELVDNPWLEKNVIKNHGPLGALYPKLDYIMEGDTPSFIGLIENGLGWSVSPAYGGWAGRYTLYKSYAETHAIWTDNLFNRDTIEVDGKPHTSNQATIWRWRRHYQHDFAARMDWCVADDFKNANHNPVAVLNGDRSKRIVELTAKPGSTVTLSARDSSDPDGHVITPHWMIYKEAGTFGGKVNVSRETGEQTTVTMPSSKRSSTIHVILTVQDKGTPSLAAYRRAIIRIQP